jgi:hypothetical protein
MAFDYPGNFFRKTIGSQEIGSPLCMGNRVCASPPDIMQHRSRLHKEKIRRGVSLCVFARTVPHCSAMSYNFCAATGIVQHYFVFFDCLIRHGRATF